MWKKSKPVLESGQRRIRTSEGECRQIYSLVPLATRESAHMLPVGFEPTTY